MESNLEAAPPHPPLPPQTGFPELTELGKRIEVLRIERGMSKQHLARLAGTSRQQLWRVLTGKSELGGTLRARLADALQVSPQDLGVPARIAVPVSTVFPTARSMFADYLADAGAIERTLSTMPGGDAGRAVKRRLLDSLEDTALATGCALDTRFFELRRRVLAGEL